MGCMLSGLLLSAPDSHSLLHEMKSDVGTPCSEVGLDVPGLYNPFLLFVLFCFKSLAVLHSKGNLIFLTRD